MNIKTLSYLVAIAETGTLSGAGKKLGISQPTLSAFLSNLECELGIDLFVRNKKQMIPTPAGRIYLDASRKILAVQEQTLQSIHQLSVKPTETIRIGVTPLRGSAISHRSSGNARGLYARLKRNGKKRQCLLLSRNVF